MFFKLDLFKWTKCVSNKVVFHFRNYEKNDKPQKPTSYSNVSFFFINTETA